MAQPWAVARDAADIKDAASPARRIVHEKTLGLFSVCFNLSIL
jgi:hypothetical protein